VLACPVCGREAPDDARYCAGCGAAIALPEAVRKERKVVSVVFVDLVGHTARSEAADPEDVQATLAPYHARVREVLERFGGTVEKFIGDAVMAVFGAPYAHEDDAERAVRAALAVRDAIVEDGLDVRAAVNTGEALVSVGAAVRDGEAFIAGDVVNTAARLQTAAPVNGVLVGAATHRATERAIEYGQAVTVEAKGKSEPVEAWEAVSPRARLGVDVAQHGAPEFVGRELELRSLVDTLERSRGAAAMQLVTLIGAPGMGKSRLVWELLRRVDAELEFTHWRQGRALAYGGGAFSAIAEAVRAHIGMLESDSADDAHQKLRVALDGLPLDEAERGWVEARLRPLVRSDGREQTLREESFVAWRRFFEAIADVSPLVLVLEDIHWADDGTLDFLEHLLDWSSDSPLLVLCTARPELLERRPTWGGGRMNSSTIALSPLSDEASARLLTSLLGRSVLAADVQARLLQQAGGNPLYAEEYVRMLQQGRTDTLPDSVQGVIAARLDGLDPGDKALLQTAAVLGKVFWTGGLAELGEHDPEEKLQRLVRKEFLRRERSSSMRGETEFAFRHALVRDVAYGQLPRVARIEKHHLAARWIASVAPHRPDLIAHHYAQVLALLRATNGDTAGIAQPARVAFQDAGDHARSLGAIDEAERHYLAALELADGERDQAVLRLALAEILREASPSASVEHAEIARAGFEATDDQAGVAQAEAAASHSLWALGDGPGSRERVARAVAAAERSGSPTALALTRTAQARALMVSGFGEEAIRTGEEAIALAEEAGLEEAAVNAMIAVGSAAGTLQRDGWEELLVTAAERARNANNIAAVQRALNNHANCLRRLRGIRPALPIYEQIAEYTRLFPLPFGVRWALGIDVLVYYQLGDWETALERADRFASTTPDVPHYLDAQVLAVRGLIAADRGALASAESLLAAALERARPVGDPQLYGPALAAYAWFLTETGTSAKARAVVEEILGQPPTIEEAVDYTVLIGCLAADVEPRIREHLPEGRFFADVNRAIVDNRLADAVNALEQTGSATEAAFLRLRLAAQLYHDERDPEPWLSGAEEFYRSVGATRRLHQIAQLRADGQKGTAVSDGRYAAES
jgi:predicted ATPase/class 3 adenylate cyclase